MKAALVVLVAAVLVLSTPTARSAPGPPNDPAWPSEWGPVLTHTADVWRDGTGSPAVVIAVVDTGVAPIEDLDGALVGGVDLLGAGQGPQGEFANHGTWVASIIAARGDNGRDAAGYCWQCSIMSVRVSDGEHPADAARVAQGIRWAVDHGARIVNVSLAGHDSSDDEAAAVAYAVAHDVLVVASAGNDGDDAPRYPGAYPSVLAVAGTDEQDHLYSWATRGAWVALAAPGCATVVDPSGAAYGCGSSFAPAAVSGIAGLLLSFDPKLTGAQVAAALRSSAHAVEGIDGGRVDAAAAFAALPLQHATNAPSSVSSPAPATAAASLEVTALHGMLTGSRSFAFATGAGRVAIRLTVRPGARCSLLLRLGSSVVFAEGDPGFVAAESTAGRKRVTVTCSSQRAVQYVLEIERPAPVP